ncbi:MAG TPA: hypothetical protein VKI40_04280, partial [Terriglobales bacterium]|nr:hypothetical protein [Terriglobales bacterium]
MDVVVVDAGGVGKERKLGVFMPHGIASRLERGERSAIFTIRRIWPLFVFVEPGKRVLGLPLQKNGASPVLLDRVKFVLSRCGIPATGSNLSLNKYWIEFIGMVPALSCDGQSSLGILARLLDIAGLQGKPRQHAQG